MIKWYMHEWESVLKNETHKILWDFEYTTVILELWGMQSTPLLPSLSGSPWARVVTPDRALSMGQIVLTAYLY